MGVAEALIISSLVSAGTSVAVADRQRRSQNRAKDKQNALATRRQQAQKKAAFQAEQQKRQLSRNQQAVAGAAARQARDTQLQQKGISTLGQSLSSAVLSDASQTGG